MPSSTSPTFALPPSGVVPVDARFREDITVPVRIDGHDERFELDTGTTQMLMDAGVAHSIGLHSTLGHTIAHDVRIGDLLARDVPIQTVGIFGGAISGILGNEFFIGHIVHIDYRHETVKVIARAHFAPPNDAHELAADYTEGLPLVSVRAGETTGTRFLLDSGSREILLNDRFVDEATALKPRFLGFPSATFFLEGQLVAQPATVDALTLGNVRFANPTVQIERPNVQNLDFPLDGILGNDVLARFEWWFDYDNARLWFR